MNYIYARPERIAVEGYLKDDCTVNSVGNALRVSYDLSWKFLMFLNVDTEGNFKTVTKARPKDIFAQPAVMRGILNSLTKKYSTPRIDYFYLPVLPNWCYPKSPLSFLEFANIHKTGTFFVTTEGHIATVKEGKLMDAWDSSEQKVNSFVEVDMEKRESVVEELLSRFGLDETHLGFETDKKQIKILELKGSIMHEQIERVARINQMRARAVIMAAKAKTEAKTAELKAQENASTNPSVNTAGGGNPLNTPNGVSRSTLEKEENSDWPNVSIAPQFSQND